jgi:hypothetical protein
MHRRTLPILLLLAMAACSDEPAAPMAPAEPAMNVVSNEVTYGWPIRVTWLDSQGPWDVLLLGYDPEDDYDCNGGSYVGGIPIRQHALLSQEGIPLGGDVRETYSIHTLGRAPLYMYRRADFPPPGATSDDWCTFLTTGFLASGSWSATLSNDNDYSGFDGTPGTNSYGGTETGQMIGTDGTRYRYEWKYRAQCDPSAGCRMMHSVDHVVRVPN